MNDYEQFVERGPSLIGAINRPAGPSDADLALERLIQEERAQGQKRPTAMPRTVASHRMRQPQSPEYDAEQVPGAAPPIQALPPIPNNPEVAPNGVYPSSPHALPRMCPDKLVVRLDGEIKVFRCTLDPWPHPGQPHYVLLNEQAVEPGTVIFVGWYNPGE